VTRGSIPRAENDLYARHTERIARALELRQLDFLSYGVLSLLVDKINLPGRNGEVLYTLEELARALSWPYKPEALRRRLHGMKDAKWIEFEKPRRGPAPWIFRLSGAAVDGERDESLVSFDPSFLPDTALREETISAQAQDKETENPQAKRVSEPSEFPPRARVEQSRAETEIENRCSEETKLDHVVGKPTADDEPLCEREPAFPELLDRLEPNPHPAGPGSDAPSQIWPDPPLEGEAGVLADLQALVDAGLGEWIDDDEGGGR
jgi:hypothetical protein